MTMSTANANNVVANVKGKKIMNIQLPPRTNFGAARNSQDSIIEGALEIVKSPLPADRESMNRRRDYSVRRGSSNSQRRRRSSNSQRRRESGISKKRGSLLCERRSSELQLDNADHLSGLMVNCKQAMAELNCDIESDYDE